MSHHCIEVDITHWPAYQHPWPLSVAGDRVHLERYGNAVDLHAVAEIEPRAPGAPCCLALTLRSGDRPRVRAAIVAPGVAVHRERHEGRRAAFSHYGWDWVCTDTLTGLAICRDGTRRGAVRAYWRQVRRHACTPGSWDEARALGSVRAHLSGLCVGGGEVRA